jgi:hypothetical protein
VSIEVLIEVTIEVLIEVTIEVLIEVSIELSIEVQFLLGDKGIYTDQGWPLVAPLPVIWE